MRTQNSAPAVAPTYSLSLVGVPPDHKVAIIKAIQKVTGASLRTAKHCAENLPSHMDDFVTHAEAVGAARKLGDAGALVNIKHAGARVSRATMQKELMSIADRAFSTAFNEMFQYTVRVNPRGHGFVRQYLRAMRAVLEDREASEAREGRA